MADLAALAGIRYNVEGDRRNALFVDEISNAINQPLIEILNKGVESGIYTTCAMQTLADIAQRPRPRGGRPQIPQTGGDYRQGFPQLQSHYFRSR